MKRVTHSVLGFAASLALCANLAANPADDMLATLRSRPDVNINVQDGWTIAIAEDGLTIWSFTPANHPAHPAYVERRIVQKDGAWYVQMNVICGAGTEICERLVADFRVLNDQLRKSLESTASPGGR